MINTFILSFISIFIALDVVGNLPIFIHITNGISPKKRNSVIDRSMIVAFLVAIIFAFVGEGLFALFGITLFDFKIAGGLVLLLISLADLIGGPEAVNRASGSTGIVPLAVPLITGPAVITSLVLQVNSSGLVISLAALLTNYLLAWIVLRNSRQVTHWLGKDGTVILSKIAALFLAAIAVSMIRGGVFDAIRVFRAL
jgi:multiple antibiotic resistance protein